MKNILIIESNPVMLHMMIGLLKSQSNFLHTLSADSVQKAIEILALEEVHLAIIGMSFSQADAYHLALLISNNPEIRIVLLTHAAPTSFCKKIYKIPSVIHFNHIRDISLLPKRVFTELKIEFGGQIQAENLTSFLQIVELDEISCKLLVTGKGRSGTLYFLDGKPMAAKMGKMTGNEAALVILAWKNVVVDIDYRPKEMSREITTSLMNLLLESGQVRDEMRTQNESLRKHKRFDCLLGAQYQVGNRIYQCLLRDISDGGAYMETDQPVKKGHPLVLFFFSPELNHSFPIRGTVVRRDTQGIGVQFEKLTSEQRQLVHSLLVAKPSLSLVSSHFAA